MKANKTRNAKNIQVIRKRSVSRSSQELKKTHSELKPLEKPNPLDFNVFIPWLCLEWEVPMTVTVTETVQDDYRRISKKTQNYQQTSQNEGSEKKWSDKVISKSEESLPIIACYDVEGCLVDISIVGYPFAIHRKIIKAISFCISFHSKLYKLTIRDGGVTNYVLYEISKLLPISNLTNICLDNNSVPEGNFHVLLEQTSQLKNLSLNMCSINDLMCAQIAASLRYGRPSCNLLTLDLGSNLITNEGAIALGEVLRSNKKLMHLNLSGNKLSSTGALSILNHLMEFPMTYDEIMEMKRASFESVPQTSVAKLEEDLLSKSPSSSKAKVKGKGRGVKNEKTKNSTDAAKEEQYAADERLLEMFHVARKYGWYYCVGNLTLCSLNLAYNNLDHISTLKIIEVLRYQEDLWKSFGTTGLLRLTIEGNNMPKECEEYGEIELYLARAISLRIRKSSSVIARKFTDTSKKPMNKKK